MNNTIFLIIKYAFFKRVFYNKPLLKTALFCCSTYIKRIYKAVFFCIKLIIKILSRKYINV